MVIIGGLGTILGSFLGAGFILLTPIFLNILFHAIFGKAVDATYYIGARTGHLRRDDYRFSDLRAAWPCAYVATDKREVTALAVSALRPDLGVSCRE